MLAALLTAAAPPPTTITDFGGGQPVVCGAQVGADLCGRLQCRLAPEAVGDSGRDDQRVVRLGDCRAVVAPAERRFGRQVQSGQRGLNGPHPIQPAEPVERNPVVAGPVVGAGQPDAEFLAADQCRFDRDSDDVGVAGRAGSR